MKKPTRSSTTTREQALATAARDKRRMIVMGFALIVLVGAYFFTQYKAAEFDREDSESLPSAPVSIEEKVAVPEIDAARLEALVSDSDEEDRVLLERAAVDELLPIARNLTSAHFEALEAREIDEALAAELLADPSAARGRAFTARGWIEELRVRQPGGGRPEEVHGKLVTDDFVPVYFIVASEPDSLVETDYARLDGLFLKAFNDEDPDKAGEWIEGPLLVGPELERSFRSLGEVTELPIDTFLEVQDDDLTGGITGIPHEAFWKLMAYARDHDRESFDYEAVPEIDTQVASEMLSDGSAWRGRAFRLPVTVVLGIWERDPGENPARMEKITEGWIASWHWKGEARVLRFSMPGGKGSIEDGDKVQGTGFFLKNYAYEPEAGGMRVASMVVFDHLEEFTPVDNESIDQLWILVAAGTALMTGILFFLVTRDRKKAAELQQKLVARRRARRDLADKTGPGGGAPSAAPPG